MGPRLPAVLYRHIISHIDNPRDLLPLFVTSNAWRQEAERQLYRFLPINDVHSEPGLKRCLTLLNHLSTCNRVAAHLRTLYVSVCHESLFDPLRRALQAAIHLKSLALNTHQPQKENLHLAYLTDGSSFMLHDLHICIPVRLDAQTFMQSQTQLTSLHWHPMSLPDAEPFFRPGDLPSLHTLSTGVYTEHLKALLISQTVLRLFCFFDFIHFPLIGPFESIRSLSVFSSIGTDLSSVFPNLCFLQAHIPILNRSIPTLRLLKKVKTFWPSMRLTPSYEECRKCADSIFSQNATLECVQIGYKRDGGVITEARSFYRGQEAAPTHPVDTDDWKKW